MYICIYVRHDGTAREQCQQVFPLGVALGVQEELLCSSMDSCSTWSSGRGGTGRAGEPCGDGRLSGGGGSVSSGSGSGCGGSRSGSSSTDGAGGSSGGEGLLAR